MRLRPGPGDFPITVTRLKGASMIHVLKQLIPIVIVSLSTAMLAACSDDSPAAGPQKPAVSRAIDEPPGANCAEGGSAFQSGVDIDGDGVLDDAEVTTTVYVCRRDRTRLVIEPPGQHCADGGTAVWVGSDENKNDVLEPAEVRDTVYLCTTTHAVLTRVTVNAANAPCAEGAAIQAGIDLDDNGVLADDEVLITEFVCGAALEKDIVIKTAADVARYQGARGALGNVVIEDAAVGEVELPQLGFVAGDIKVIGNQSLTALRLPQLRTVHRVFELSKNAVLTELTMPALQLAGVLVVSENEQLATIATSEFQRVTITGQFRVLDNPALQTIDWDVDTTGSILIARNPALTAVRWRGGFRVNDVEVRDNLELRTLDVIEFRVMGNVVVANNPVLTTAELNLFDVKGDVRIVNNPELNALRFDRTTDGMLVHGNLTITGNTITVFEVTDTLRVDGDVALANLRVTKLSSPSDLEFVRGNLSIRDNPLLSEVAALSIGGAVEITNNPALETATVDYAQSTGPHAAAQIDIVNNAALKNFSASALTSAGTVSIAQNPALTGFGLSTLLSAEKIEVTDNAALPVCQILALFTQIASPSESQSGNKEDGACP